MMTKDELIAFEVRIKGIFEEGWLPFLLHLCGGNEEQLIGIFNSIKPGDWVLSSHRSHYHYLLKTGNAGRLEQLIRDGKSMFVFDANHRFLTSSVLAGTCGIAAGLALAESLQQTGNRVWCFLGDGAEDEGHFYEAVRFVHGAGLPCTFIVEDNDRSVDTAKDQRGSGEIAWPDCVIRYSYTPTYPHAGTGTKTWVKFKDVKPVG